MWNATDITSFTANIDRQIRETIVSSSSGFIQTNISLGAEHALTPRTLLDADLGWAQFDFQGNGAGGTREDDVIQAQLGAQYKLINGAALKANYRYSDRSSNIPINEFTGNIFNIGLGYAY